MFIELIGITGTLLIILAFCNTNKKKIRIYDSIGALLFVIYGLLIGAFSTWLLNLILIIINIYKIKKGE